jgi:hypothetical protein
VIWRAPQPPGGELPTRRISRSQHSFAARSAQPTTDTSQNALFRSRPCRHLAGPAFARVGRHVAGLDSRDVSARLSKIAVDAGYRQLVDAPLPPTHLPGCGCTRRKLGRGPRWSSRRSATIALSRGCRTNQTGCTNLTTVLRNGNGSPQNRHLVADVQKVETRDGLCDSLSPKE